MKKLLFLSLLLPTVLFSQAPELMSYQTVVWDGSNNLVTNANVGFQMSILQGSPTGTAVFVEEHTVMTNTNGLASFQIGGGTVTTGSIAGIDWSSGPYYLKSEADPNGGTNYTISGTSQLITVPYAFYATVADSVVNDMVDDADPDPTNELNTSFTLVGTTLNITDAGGTLSADLSSLTDADPDPTNELQTLTIVGSVLTLSNGGGSVTIPSGGNPTDELNTSVVLNGTDLEITDTGGTLSADLSSIVANPTDELQDLSFSNDSVYITNGVETYVGPENPINPSINAPAANIGLPFSDVAFYRHNGRVYLQGRLTNCSLGQVLFTLPVGYRPGKTVALTSQANNAFARVDVYPNGNVSYLVGPATADVTLDGLSFRITN